MRVKVDIAIPNVGHKGGVDFSTYSWPVVRSERELMQKLLELRPLRAGITIRVEVEEEA